MTAQLTLRQRMLGGDELTSCLRTRRQLQRFLDGEPEPATVAGITRHLDGCRACGRQAQIYRDIKQPAHPRGFTTAAASPAPTGRVRGRADRAPDLTCCMTLPRHRLGLEVQSHHPGLAPVFQ